MEPRLAASAACESPEKSPDLVDRFRFAGQIRRFRQQLTPKHSATVRASLLWGPRVGGNVRQPAHQRGIEIDINTVKDIVRRPPERPGTLWRDGDAWLAGGTWLFSEQQPHTHRLVDLLSLGWHEIAASDTGLSIGATCTVRDLYEFDPPSDWLAGSLLKTSCEAFLASFKVWNSATVGGNICMSLPAGPMITMTVALEAVYTLWAPDGSERTVKAADFVTGNQQNILAPGEVLRKIDIPISALRKRHAHRRFTLTKLGRSTIFMIGTQPTNAADVLLTITAATTHPILLAFDSVPDADELQERIDRLPDDVWFDDANGAPDHRRHLATHYAEEIRMELAAGG
jgi:CO/xanthine dehydrogenase FAD-binding subunit